MKHRFDLIARTAGAWSERSDLSPAHREAANTLCLMAHRFEHGPAPDLVADKSLKVLGCHLCRLAGNPDCHASASQQENCTLGFVPMLDGQ